MFSSHHVGSRRELRSAALVGITLTYSTPTSVLTYLSIYFIYLFRGRVLLCSSHPLCSQESLPIMSPPSKCGDSKHGLPYPVYMVSGTELGLLRLSRHSTTCVPAPATYHLLMQYWLCQRRPDACNWGTGKQKRVRD